MSQTDLIARYRAAAAKMRKRFDSADESRSATLSESLAFNLFPALLDAGDALASTSCKCPRLIQCPQCNGVVVEGRDQYADSWICGKCVKAVVDLPRDSTQPCKRCAALAALTDALEKELGENNGS